MKKYAVHPGWIEDKWFSFERLAELYNVPLDKCVSCIVQPTITTSPNIIHLYPREDAVYHSPEYVDSEIPRSA